MTRLTVYKNPDGSGYLVDLQADIRAPRKTSSRPLLVKLQRPESCCCLQR